VVCRWSKRLRENLSPLVQKVSRLKLVWQPEPLAVRQRAERRIAVLAERLADGPGRLQWLARTDEWVRHPMRAGANPADPPAVARRAELPQAVRPRIPSPRPSKAQPAWLAEFRVFAVKTNRRC
jgi:hypothetical protein